jgi:DNA-binding MarR family transcriptional regulator
MIDLAKEQLITGAGMTSIVDHLGDVGLIEREKNESDRRVVKVAISKKGEAVVKQGLELYRKLIEKATRQVTEQDKRNLLTTFDSMIGSVEEG